MKVIFTAGDSVICEVVDGMKDKHIKSRYVLEIKKGTEKEVLLVTEDEEEAEEKGDKLLSMEVYGLDLYVEKPGEERRVIRSWG